jgi:hypothetical protein
MEGDACAACTSHVSDAFSGTSNTARPIDDFTSFQCFVPRFLQLSCIYLPQCDSLSGCLHSTASQATTYPSAAPSRLGRAPSFQRQQCRQPEELSNSAAAAVLGQDHSSASSAQARRQKIEAMPAVSRAAR